eukprot:Blabericola_migrator_1__6917@NODE_3505_length_1720_cov_151_121597_g2176_i0_p1_GENE_NODE_3505_length_1720_cov_151_121597_g2176_i0NODE_3505_length_1720_cov_151_121597_g2176_i0_p1_ORF_typecomplete_len465_score78_76ADH_N/PF08240_12/1_8e32ADH_N/PF08240_12/3e03ADH_zinc_N/PF00107_26/6_4e03ADH_zinc_N/PF00107_26/8_5e27Glu_dehyd_C/PF16912_5/1_9e11AlaDh_PNT_C/PF01262_21/0_012IGFBP/PF00219_18/4_8e03IGFBP/PF00219_18/0_11_NODE_3505_length_1720_cov_151_121597_g2176_i01271521
MPCKLLRTRGNSVRKACWTASVCRLKYENKEVKQLSNFSNLGSLASASFNSARRSAADTSGGASIEAASKADVIVSVAIPLIFLAAGFIMEPVQCRAAVAYKPLEPLRLTTITVDPPKAGEVRIRILATSVCHTDVYTWSGKDPEGVFPCILGHEGAGIVDCVGEGVTELHPGDHVVPLYTPECRACKFCKSGKTNLCGAIRETQGKGLMPDKTVRFKDAEGNELHHYMGCSTFSEYTVMPIIAVAKINKDLPLTQACLLGCGIPTGIGAARNTAKVEPGAVCAVLGLGCVGLATVLGCKLCEASRIIAIDFNEDKFPLAKELGATDCVNPAKLDTDIKTALIDMTDGGVDYSFEAIGNVETMRQALEACHKGWGQSIIIGVAGSGEVIQTRPFQLVTGRVWKGTAFGGVKGRTEVPQFVDMALNGKLPINKFITRQMKFEDINSCFNTEHKAGGLDVRTVLTY